MVGYAGELLIIGAALVVGALLMLVLRTEEDHESEDW